MRKTGTMFLAGFVVLMQAACSSGESSGGGGTSSGPAAGAPPDFNSLETTLTKPTGTFAAGEESKVQEAFATQSTAAQGNPFGGSSGSSSTKSAGEISLQALELLEGGSCADLGKSGGKGSCDCPNGGTLTFDVPANLSGDPGKDPSGAVDQTLSIVAKTCGMSADQTINGSIYWKVKSPPPFQLFSVHIEMTGKQTAKYDVEYLLKDGVVTFAVDVADGKVLVSAKGNWNKETKSGTLVITDKGETWTCEMTNGKGTCKDSKGVERAVG